MGQYWIPVNLTKKEYIDPHVLGAGLKLWEQLANHPGTGAALIVLTAAMPERRGGGDFDLEPGPTQEDYAAVAKRTIGRWAGDRIALIGDYAEDGDIKGVDCSKIYSLTRPHDRDCEIEGPHKHYIDISADVARVIEHELQGKYEGERGWRTWKESA